MQVQDCVAFVAGIGVSGNPPAGELRFARLGLVELDFPVRNAWSRADRARWMEQELPASLIKEQAERSVGAEQGCRDHNAERRKQPPNADQWLPRRERINPSRSSGLGMWFFG